MQRLNNALKVNSRQTSKQQFKFANGTGYWLINIQQSEKCKQVNGE